MNRWRDTWGQWCATHPMTILYLLIVATLNVILNVLTLVLK